MQQQFLSLNNAGSPPDRKEWKNKESKTNESNIKITSRILITTAQGLKTSILALTHHLKYQKNKLTISKNLTSFLTCNLAKICILRQKLAIL